MPSEETVVVSTRTPASTRARARQHEFVIDKLPASGGDDEGPMASEYLLAALASCQITTAHKIAVKRGEPIDAISITATLWIERGCITNIKLDIDVSGGPDDDELDTILRLTERSCTVSQALSVPIERRVRRAAA